MATTYTVTNTFVTSTTAVASEVNQNFTDVLAALNSLDAGNLGSGTITLARISGLTSTQMSASYFLDEDDMSSNSATAVASQQSLKAYVDTQDAAGVAGQWHASSVTVFDTTLASANTFEDLDLSGTIGTNAALCFLEIKASTTGAYAMKAKGFGGTLASHTSAAANAYGGSQFHPEGANEYCYMTIAADSSGILQHGSVNNTTTYTIKLLGYVR